MLLLILLWRLSAVIANFMHSYMPTNILLDRLRTHSGPKWAVPVAMLLFPTYLLAANITTTLIARGGPDWMNLFVMLCIWNAMKFGWLVPVILIQSSTGPRRPRPPLAQ